MCTDSVIWHTCILITGILLFHKMCNRSVARFTHIAYNTYISKGWLKESSSFLLPKLRSHIIDKYHVCVLCSLNQPIFFFSPGGTFCFDVLHGPWKGSGNHQLTSLPPRNRSFEYSEHRPSHCCGGRGAATVNVSWNLLNFLFKACVVAVGPLGLFCQFHHFHWSYNLVLTPSIQGH